MIRASLSTRASGANTHAPTKSHTALLYAFSLGLFECVVVAGQFGDRRRGRRLNPEHNIDIFIQFSGNKPS